MSLDLDLNLQYYDYKLELKKCSEIWDLTWTLIESVNLKWLDLLPKIYTLKNVNKN